jgi:hypothetical protein
MIIRVYKILLFYYPEYLFGKSRFMLLVEVSLSRDIRNYLQIIHS